MSGLNRKRRQRQIRDTSKPAPPAAPLEAKAAMLAHQVGVHLISLQKEIDDDLELVRLLLAARRRVRRENPDHAYLQEHLERYTAAIRDANARIRDRRAVLETTRQLTSAAA